VMSSCWHFSFSIFSQYLSVQSMEFGWDLDLDWGAACFLFFFFYFWDHLFGHRNDWVSMGFLFLFSFLFWSNCRFHTSDGCILGYGRDNWVGNQIGLNPSSHLLIPTTLAHTNNSPSRAT
jgi:hypothetical protein